MGSLLGSLPILGPILQPLLPLLGAIGLSEASVSAQTAHTITPDQLATLADIQTLLFNATHEVTSSLPKDAALAKSTLKARGLLPLGSILTGLPIIGPFLQPLLPLLDSIGLASVDASPQAMNTLSLNEDQNAKLAQLKAILVDNVPDLMPEDSDKPELSPEAAGSSATPAPTNGAAGAEDSTPTSSTPATPSA